MEYDGLEFNKIDNCSGFIN